MIYFQMSSICIFFPGKSEAILFSRVHTVVRRLCCMMLEAAMFVYLSGFLGVFQLFVM